DIIIRQHVIRRISYLIICIIFYNAVPGIFDEFQGWIKPLQKLLAIGTLWYAVRIIVGLLWCVVDYQATYQSDKQRSFKGLIQFATIIVYFLGAIILLSILLNKSPLVFIGGLGAASAVLMLIFRDSILGLVAGVQLAYNDIVRIGDWITMAKFNADGTVVDITLTTVKVQNFDLTVTTIPAYNLISDSVVNWRSMSDSKHRRIQRAFNIDMTGIRFCEPDFIAHLAQIEALADFMKPYAAVATAEAGTVLPHGGLTNVFLFRKYIEFYLRHHPNIENADGYTLMVRQLAMDDFGLPIQIYCFTRTSEWLTYEAIQADVFDHLLAMAPVFGLAVFERTAQVDARLGAPALPTIDA
ncbi:MAG: mechanosensitive ion channel family protein, partial [Bacteroidales bacterium]|nr:mechanosensitive ion channel family protein [Bacteroidales bacterium]